MSDLTGKNYVITGANTGIGKAAALQLAARGGRVILACRSEAKTMPVIDEIKAAGNPNAEFMSLDLGSLDSIRGTAAALNARNLHIDGLINNAGVAGQRGQTKDGFELQFGTNHIGHYLWTRLLLDRVKASAPNRIVIVASNSHLKAKGIDWDAVQQPTKTYAGLHEYEVSKLCNVLFQRELTRRLGPNSPVHTYALNPGRVATDGWRRIPQPFRWLVTRFMITSEQGGSYTVKCATDGAIANDTGRYYNRGKVQDVNPLVTDALALDLWNRSAAWVGLPAD